MKRKTDTKKLVLMALTASIAMVLSAIEMQIPAFTTIPGVKIGFANRIKTTAPIIIKFCFADQARPLTAKYRGITSKAELWN